MRYSKQRELVLQKVEQLCDHPTAEEIFDLAAKECPGLSLGTVYRNLNSLVDAGRVRRVSIPGKADRFDHTLGWHSHLYCNCCGGVVDADVDEKQVMKLVRSQKGVVQDCAVVRPVRGVRRQAGSVKINSCPPRPKRVYYKELSL
jgi:Fe2+ or Zn2+ uptake regulation protein